MKKRTMILTAVLTAAVLAGSGYLPANAGNRLIQTVSAAKKDSDTKDGGSVLDQATLMYQQYNDTFHEFRMQLENQVVQIQIQS